MSSIILAGGTSSRMGQDKCSLVLAGDSLLQRIVSRLSQLDSQIILVLARGQSTPISKTTPQVEVTLDVQNGKGPLVGIYSGLKASSDYHSIAVACDMPFINIELIRYMFRIAHGFDVVMPRLRGMIEPLHAIYSVGCLGTMERMLRKDNLQIRGLLQAVKTRYIEESEINLFDPEHRSIFNINTPADLEKAEQIAHQEEVPQNDIC